MEILYNPNQMSEEEIDATFVARQPLVDELLDLVAKQPDGAGVQHVVLIAPRGMGKTTLLLKIRFGIRDRRLDRQWQPVQFPEEPYRINDLADFWMEILFNLAAQTGDATLQEQTERLGTQHTNTDDLRDAALALLKDWRKRHKKRVLVLVDNIDMMFEQIHDEQDNARLRNVLMNDGALMLIGAGATYFEEARAYDQPLYNFFKLYDLETFRFDEIEELFRRRAAYDKRENVEELLKANRTRLRALEYFTGGNPRLALMLYHVVTRSRVEEVRRALDKLLDEVTPYYKAKMESLPPQQRKLLDHLARESGRTHEGVSPTDLARMVRLTPNQTAEQLKRLAGLGYVRAANVRGRSAFYVLSEPLYAIWSQMRMDRTVRQRLQFLVDFLSAWYDETEKRRESDRIADRIAEYLSHSQLNEAKNALEFLGYLAEAAKPGPVQREIKGKFERASVLLEFETAFDAADYEKAVEQADRILALNPEVDLIWYNRGVALWHLARYEEALASFDRALALDAENTNTWTNRGVALGRLDRYEEALASYDRALALDTEKAGTWYNRGMALGGLGRYEEALASFDRALALDVEDADTWTNRGVALGRLDRYEEALASFDRALALDPEDAGTWHNRGVALERLDRYEEALASFDRTLALNPEDALSFLERVAKTGHWQFTRDLITKAGLDERLFPLARALDYLLTGDEGLIEKLSPEMRGIVKDVVETLRASSPQQEAPIRPSRKRTSGPRKRTRKQLT